MTPGEDLRRLAPRMRQLAARVAHAGREQHRHAVLAEPAERFDPGRGR